MSHLKLVELHKGRMELEDESAMTILETAEDTGAPVRSTWVLKRIHETSMSTVFLATDKHGYQKIVKRIMSSRLSMNELGALVWLNASPRKHLFVKMDQWFACSSLVYCMMEYLPMGDLSSFRKEYQPSETSIQSISRQILLALKEMHDLGYTHRDIKPQNILMSSHEPPSIKICDFGISKQHAGAHSFTNTGSSSPSYAAPEVLRLSTSKIDEHVNNKVDMWALGCVIAELVTGHVLFDQKNTTYQFCTDPGNRMQRLGLVTQGLSTKGTAFVTELLQPEPNNRPSAEDALSRPWMCNLPPSTGLYSRSAPDAQRKTQTVIVAESRASQEGEIETEKVGVAVPAKYKKSRATQMHLAAEYGDIEEIGRLVALGQDRGVKDRYGRTPMHYAAMGGNVAVLDYLSKKLGQDPGVQDNHGETPMHAAAHSGKMAIVDYLVRLGQDASVRDEDGLTPLYHAATTKHVAMVIHLASKLGQDAGAKSWNGRTPMHGAARHGQIAMVECLRKLGQDVGARDDLGGVPMHYAASEGHIAMVDHLKSLGQSISVRNNGDETPLYGATEHGHIAMVEHLRKLGQDVEQRSILGATPMHSAAAGGSIAMVDHLKSLGQDIAIQDGHGTTPLHVAAENGQIAMLEHLRSLGQDIRREDDSGRTSMHHAVFGEQVAMVNHLRRLGQDIGSRDSRGLFLMHHAASHGQIAMVDYLASQGQALAVKTSDGRTPIDLAAHYNQEAMVAHLAKKGCRKTRWLSKRLSTMRNLH